MPADFKINKDIHTFKKLDFELIQDNSIILEVRFTVFKDVIDSDAPQKIGASAKQKEKFFPLEGAILYMTVRKTAEDSIAVIQKSSLDDISITNPTNGIAEIEFFPEDTATLEPGVYIYDIKIETAEGRKYTPIKGELTIIAGVSYQQSGSTGTGTSY